MTQPQVFRLKVQQVQQTCLFDLLSGQGQHRSAMIPYPEDLETAYQLWQRAYLSFYQHMAPSGSAPLDLRGRLVTEGKFVSMGVDWQAELVAAEAELRHQFHQWLRGRELFDLRGLLSRSLRNPTDKVDVFLVCEPLSLARLPWETWALDGEGTLRLARCPGNVRTPVVTSARPRRRMRVLAIFGDETGLDFQADRSAVRTLAARAEVQVMGWQPQQPIAEFKQQVCDAVVDPQGWDILFFAGHSNETKLTGGELAIAPGFTLTVQEITPYLEQLCERGLQLAIFNSCSGLSIATALVGLGLGQVVVMREPVHNRVAQIFLDQLLQALCQPQDAHAALRTAALYLQQDMGLTYPSAYLVPSLFRHPDAALFQLQPTGLRHQLTPWLPTLREGVTVAILVALSLWSPLLQGLLQGRLLAQAVYREATTQIPEPRTPPVALIQIDETSLQLAKGLTQPHPMNRAYLGRLIERLQPFQPQIMGLDYLLDFPQGESDQVLADAVDTAIDQHNTWFVFAALPQDNGTDFGVHPDTGIGSAATRLKGHIEGLPTHMTLPGMRTSCEQSCPFAYLLALLAAAQRTPGTVRPRLENRGDLRSRLLRDMQQNPVPNSDTQYIQAQKQHWVSWLSRYFGQQWLRPILDISVPPEQVYQRIPAWRLLQEDTLDLSNPVVLIAPGGYAEAGVSSRESDTFDLPWALAYWQSLAPEDPESSAHSVFTGGEAHAYMVHHFLHKRMVIPVPNLWMVLVAAILGKAILLSWGNSALQNRWRVIGYGSSAISLYGLIGLQLYLSASVLLPWLLPSVTFCLYLLPVVERHRHE